MTSLILLEQWVMDRVSEGHLKWAYPWRTLLDTGVVVSGGEQLVCHCVF